MGKLISLLFHPLFAPIYSLAMITNLPLYINFKYGDDYFLYIYFLFFVNLVLAPLFVSIYLKRIKMIDSLEMRTVKERVIPYLTYLIFYSLTYFLLYKLKFPELYLMLYLMAGFAVALLLIFALIKWKVSAHLTAMGGVCGMLVILSTYFAVDLSTWLMTAVLASGLVATSRLQMKAHSAMDLLFGFFLGLGSQLSIFLFV
jgi:hypothetical protein